MARLLRIERAIRWMAKTLTANRDPLPFPEGIINVVNPIIDVFGSQRIEEIQFEIVNAGLGEIQVVHGPVPIETVRQYLSMEYVHDDVVNRGLRAGRLIRTPTAVSFAGMRDEISVPAGQFLAVRNFTVGPTNFAAVETAAMGAGGRMAVIVTWIDTPTGEYLRSIQ